MRAIRLFLYVFLLALVCSSVHSQEATRRDVQAATLLQLSFASMGGANLGSIRDTVANVEGTTLRQGERAAFTATFKTLGANAFRAETNSADGTTSWVFSDGKVLSRRGGGDVRSLSRMSAANGGITHIPVLSVFGEWVETRNAVEYVGLETIDGAEAHHIRLRRPWPGPNGPPEEPPACDIFLDARTLLLIRLVYPMHSASNIRISEPVTMSYSNYRVISGLAIPHTVTQSIRGHVVSEFRVTRFAVNQGIAPSEFELR